MKDLRESFERLPPPRRRGGSPQFWLAAFLVVGMLTAILFLWIWTQMGEQRAIEELPAAERQSLYRRTLEDLRTVCARHSSDLDLHCEAQARFILQFPECDETCRRLARKQLPMPTR